MVPVSALSIPLGYSPAVLSLTAQIPPPAGFQDCSHSDASSAEWVPVVIRSSDQASAVYWGHPCVPMQSVASEQKREPGFLCGSPSAQCLWLSMLWSHATVHQDPGLPCWLAMCSAAGLGEVVQEAWPGGPLHIMAAEGIGVQMALAAILEMVCEENVAVLEVTLLGKQCTIVGLLHWAPQVLSAAQV